MTEVTVGFDGSRQRHQGTTDATAIVCATLDGHVFVPCGGGTIWQAPPGPAGYGWEVPDHRGRRRDPRSVRHLRSRRLLLRPQHVARVHQRLGRHVRSSRPRTGQPAAPIHVLADRTPVHQRGRSVPPSRHRRRAHPRRQPAPHRPRPERPGAGQLVWPDDREGVSFLGPKDGRRRRRSPRVAGPPRCARPSRTTAGRGFRTPENSLRFWLRVRYYRTLSRLCGLRDDFWRWRHRRCVRVLQRRPEYRQFSDLDRVCRRCRARLVEQELRLAPWLHPRNY